MIVNVTQENIQRSKRAKTNACPVALAIKQTIGPFWHVSVIPNNVYFYRGIAEENRPPPSRSDRVHQSLRRRRHRGALLI